MDFEERIEGLFLDLPESPKDTGTLANFSKLGKLIYLSGQLPHSEGRLSYKGRVGLELNLDAGKSAARAAFIQALGVLKGELGTLNKIKKIVSLNLYIATGAEFKDHKKILTSLMDLVSEIFGSFGRCAADAVGCASLPEGAAVLLSMVVEVK